VNLISDGKGLLFPAAEPEAIHPQIYQFSLGQNKAAPVTSDLASYNKLSVSANHMAAIQKDRLSAIWITRLDDPAHPRRITPPAGRYWQLAWLPDGSLVSQTGTGRELNIWRFFQDGSRRQITSGPYIDWDSVVSMDGRRVAFVSNRAGGLHLWTCDPEGHFLRQLTNGQGDDSSPSFMLDGSIVYTETTSGSSGIFKVSSDGISRVRLLSPPARNPVVSPNGEYLACDLNDRGERWQTAVIEIRTGRVVRRFPDIPESSWLRWTADGNGLAYISTRNGVSNIVVRPLADTPEERLTEFGEDVVFSFDVARGGRGVASVRGIAVSDVVVLERAH
jgi:Tol biopolymer transport system component